MTDTLLAEPSVNSQDIVKALLEVTGTTEPPTNAEHLAAYLGLRVEDFDPDELGLSHKIRAFLWPAKRLIGVHHELKPKRRKFSILHEVGHFVLPEHITRLEERGKITDDLNTLSTNAIIKLEIEANQFAADCLFQLDRFDDWIHNAELNWDNIRAAANEYEASIEATARRWVEGSPYERALVVFDPVSREIPDTPLEILYTITSQSFRVAYFSGLRRGQRMDKGTLAYNLYHRVEPQETEGILRVRISPTEVEDFQMTLFNNTYRVLALLRVDS